MPVEKTKASALGGVAAVLLNLALQISGYQSPAIATFLVVVAVGLFLPLFIQQARVFWQAGKYAWGIYGEPNPIRSMIILMIAGALIGLAVAGAVGLTLRRAHLQTPPMAAKPELPVTLENVDAHVKEWVRAFPDYFAGGRWSEEQQRPEVYFIYHLIFPDNYGIAVNRTKDQWDRFIILALNVNLRGPALESYNKLSDDQKSQLLRDLDSEAAKAKIANYGLSKDPSRILMITKDIPINDTLTKTSFYDAIGNIHSELRLMVSTMGKILSGLAPDAPSVSPSPPSQTSSAATRLQDVFPFGYYVFSNKEGRWTYEATPEADKLQYHIDPNEVQIEPDFANRTVHWKIPYSAKRQNGRGMIYVNNTLVATVPMVKPHSSSGVVNPIFSVGVVVEANQPSFFVVTLDDDQRFPVFALGFRIPEKPTPPAHALTNEELVKRLFPKPIRRHVRKVAASKPKGK